MSGDVLTGLTAFVSGGSRGIGLQIARQLAASGVNIALMAKTEVPNEKLPGTVYDAAEELRALGVEVLPLVGDIRDEDRVAAAVAETVEVFGGIDLCLNNASALDLSPIGELPLKRFDLLYAVGVRGTFAVTQACLPHLRRSHHARVLTMSPPFNFDPVWFGPSAYTASKYGMTIVTLGLARSERQHGVAANCLWPLTSIATAVVQNLLGGDEGMAASRTSQIVADAAMVVLRRDADYTGNTAIVEDVLAAEGITDLEGYNVVAGQTTYAPDFFIDPQRLNTEVNALQWLQSRG